jgi:hypothetical protein
MWSLFLKISLQVLCEMRKGRDGKTCSSGGGFFGMACKPVQRRRYHPIVISVDRIGSNRYLRTRVQQGERIRPCDGSSELRGRNAQPRPPP